MDNYKNINKKQGKDFQSRFKNLQHLETINYVAPHQNILQALVGNAVLKEASRIKLTNSDCDIEILEIGTGQGLTAKEILKAGGITKIISIDNDSEMIKQANRNLEEYINSGKIDIRTADALEFLKGLPENSLPIVVSGFTLHNFKNDYREKVLAEIYRILKNGGVFINADKIMPDDEKVFEHESIWQYEQFKKISDQKIRKEWIKHYKEDEMTDVIMREDALKKTMKQAGFIDIVISSRCHLDALAIARK